MEPQLYFLCFMLGWMSCDDLRYRKVSNEAMMVTFIGVGAITGTWAIYHSDWHRLLVLGGMTCLGIVLGYLLFKKLKQGGADAKILISITTASVPDQFVLFLVFMLPVLILYHLVGDRFFTKPYPLVPGMMLAYMMAILIQI